MKHTGLFAAVLIVYNALVAVAEADLNVTFTISTEAYRSPISPYIYGTNWGSGANFTIVRSGGNRLTGYNWENNFSNAGNDYYHWNDRNLVGGLPSGQQLIPGIAITTFHDSAIANNRASVVTLQMAGYVSADDLHEVTVEQKAPSSRWKNVVYAKGAPFCNPPGNPDGNDPNVYMDEFVNFLVSRYGYAGQPNGVKFYDLDNEPDIWSNGDDVNGTHPRLHPPKATCTELMERSVALSIAVKNVDPNAQILGPVSYGFNGYHNFQDANDWESLKNGYNWFLDYYLDRMEANSVAAGRRLLDVLDLHWYPEAHDGSGPFDGNRIVDVPSVYSRANCQARMQAPRTLWDPDYLEESWIAEWCSDHLPILPEVFESINNYYQGTKLAFTEYDYGAQDHYSGGIATADVLGIFGKYGVYMATYWGSGTYVNAACNIYRNYDGAHSTFGDTKVAAIMSDKQNSSIYASVSGPNDLELHLIVINKNFDDAINGSFNIISPHSYKSAAVWAFDDSSPTITERAPLTSITGNAFSYTIPPLTVCHIVLYVEGGPRSPADLDSDGDVDSQDMGLFADEWLHTGLNIDGPNSPVLWYKFNQTSGTNVPDQTGSFPGTVQNLGAQTWEPGAGYDGNGCINLTNGSHTYVTVPPQALNFAAAATGVTFSAWVKTYIQYPPSGEWPELFDAWIDSNEVFQTFCPTPIPPTYASGPQVHFNVGANGVGSATLDINDLADDWHHYVFVKDTLADTMSIYYDGQVLAHSTNATGPMFPVPVSRFYIGTRDQWWGYWVGRIDDFRIYNYALSAEEVTWITTDGTGEILLPLDSPANLYKSSPEIIDFRDFARFAEDWLK